MSRRWFLLALLAYSAIAILLTGPALIGQGSLVPEGFLDRDQLYTQGSQANIRPFGDQSPVVLELGRTRAIASGLQQGRLETWNPWSGAGAPLWAEQGGPFFPTNLIYYLYPHHSTRMAALAARLVVAALGMFFLARALGLSPWVALFSGALFEYSGSLAAELAFGTMAAIYMFPWVLLGAQRLYTKPGSRAVAVSGLALGVASLGGHPSLILLNYLGFGAWLAGELAHKPPPLKELKPIAAFALAAGSIAFLIAASGLLPFLELMLHGQSYKNTAAGEIAWGQRLLWTRQVFLTAMFLPSHMTAAQDAMRAYLLPYANGASIGLVGLLLAIAGAHRLRKHWGLILIAIIGVGLTLAPPGLAWLHQIPGLRIVMPWYCYPFIIVPECIAAGYGMQFIASASRRKPLAIFLWAMLCAVLLCGVSLAAVALLGGKAALLSLKDAITSSGLIYLDMNFIRDWKTYLSPAAALVAAISYWFLCRSNLKRAAGIVAMVALVEATAIRIPTIIFERSAVLTASPSEATAHLQALLSEGSWRFIGVPVLELGTPNTSVLFGLRDFRSTSALTISRLAEFMDLAARPEEFRPNPTFQYPLHIQLPMLSLAAVKYVAYSTKSDTPADIPPGLVEKETVGNVAFFENPQALPRFRIVHDVIPAKDESDALESVQRLIEDSSPGTAPAYTRRAVIEGIGSVSPPSEVVPAGYAESVERLSEPTPETIVLKASLAATGFVLVADTFYPGWTATVDDVPAPIHPANLLFRAVAVPAGQHIIVMKYRSSWLPIGAMFTLAGLLLVVGLFVRDKRAPAAKTIMGADI